jgi:hypothetical protein
MGVLPMGGCTVLGATALTAAAGLRQHPGAKTVEQAVGRGNEACIDLDWLERATYTQLLIRTCIEASQRRSSVAGVVIYGCHGELSCRVVMSTVLLELADKRASLQRRA